MGTLIRITGAIDRRDPDPAAPIDPTRTFIGTLEASWTHDGPRAAAAAILKVATGGGVVEGWGTHVLCLRWIGDPPAPEIAQAVYDAIRDRGDGMRTLALQVETMARGGDVGGTYRTVRLASAR
jgi:hypothetical protein